MIRDRSWRFIRFSIYPLLWILDVSRHLAEPFSTMSEFAVLVSGLIASSLIGLVYISPIIIVVVLIIRERRGRIDFNPVYPLSALMVGLLLFAFAEIIVSSSLMVIASSMVVLSSMAFTSMAPASILFAKRKVE